MTETGLIYNTQSGLPGIQAVGHEGGSFFKDSRSPFLLACALIRSVKGLWLGRE